MVSNQVERHVRLHARIVYVLNAVGSVRSTRSPSAKAACSRCSAVPASRPCNRMAAMRIAKSAAIAKEHGVPLTKQWLEAVRAREAVNGVTGRADTLDCATKGHNKLFHLLLLECLDERVCGDPRCSDNF